jgi:hypothetical protein
MQHCRISLLLIRQPIQPIRDRFPGSVFIEVLQQRDGIIDRVDRAADIVENPTRQQRGRQQGHD